MHQQKQQAKRLPELARLAVVAIIPLAVVATIWTYCQLIDNQLVASDSVETFSISQFDPVRDFGDVRQGKLLTARFPATNIGNRRVILNQVGSSCECARGDRETIILQPGESTELIGVLDTNHLEGSFKMEIEYSSSDPAMPRFKLVLLANVIPQP